MCEDILQHQDDFQPMGIDTAIYDTQLLTYFLLDNSLLFKVFNWYIKAEQTLK